MALTEKLTAIADAIRVQSGKTGKLTLDQMPSEIVDLQSLGFEVVGGTSAPSSPKENTIWINTSTEITGWQFASDDPNLVNFNEWISDSYIVGGTKAVSGNSVTLNASADNCYTQYTGDTAPEVSCNPGETYIFEWTHSGSPGRVYIFPNKATTGMVYVDASIGKIEYTVPDGVYLFSFRIGVNTSGTSATYSNIRITKKERAIEPGAVWIQTGKSSNTEFNSLKKNNITVYPISAKQYVSGEWVDKEAKSYQNGAWVDWYNGELYKGGNQYENITGGWKKSALTWSGLPTNGSISYGEYLTVKANSGGYYDATTVNKLDLTEYSQLRYDIASDSATDDAIVVIHQKESGVIWSSTPYWTASSNDGILPLTGISGLYYISVLAMNNKTIKVGNIRLVK